MTHDETLKLMTLFKAAWPSYYRDMKRPDAESTVALWHRMLADLPCDLVIAAAERMISTLKFPPTIADMRGAVADAVGEASGEISAGEAWARVRKALSRFGYYCPSEACEWLGERIWAAVDMVGGWSYLCTTDNDASTLSAQFERRYRAAVEQRKNTVQIPQHVRDTMAGLVEKMTIPGYERQALPPIHAQTLAEQAQVLRLEERVREGCQSKSPGDLRKLADEAEQRRRQADEAGQSQAAALHRRLRDGFIEMASAQEGSEAS